MNKEETYQYVRDVAWRLRELFLNKYGDPENPLRLNLVKLCSTLGGSIEVTDHTSAYKDSDVLVTQEEGRFLVYLRAIDHFDVPYESSFKLAQAIGDWLLNFTNAEPGTVCRTYRAGIGNKSISYAATLRFAWALLLPADLFESAWWLYECDVKKVAEMFGVPRNYVMQRTQHIGAPMTKHMTLQAQESLR